MQFATILMLSSETQFFEFFFWDDPVRTRASSVGVVGFALIEMAWSFSMLDACWNDMSDVQNTSSTCIESCGALGSGRVQILHSRKEILGQEKFTTKQPTDFSGRIYFSAVQTYLHAMSTHSKKKKTLVQDFILQCK